MKQPGSDGIIKVAVLVSGGGTNLQALIDGVNRGGVKNCEIALVVSSRDRSYAVERACNAGIPAVVMPKKGVVQEQYDRQLIELLEKYDINLVVLAGFLAVLGRTFTKRFENAIINVHPSLIPAFCGEGFYGLRVHERALEYGVKVTGATVHFVNDEVDGGPVILQKAVEVMDSDTPEALQKRVMTEAEWVLLPRAVSLFCEGRLKVLGRRVIILGRGEE